jgi:hypothetical protein
MRPLPRWSPWSVSAWSPRHGCRADATPRGDLRRKASRRLLDDRGRAGDNEAIFVRFEAGEETAAISLDGEVFENGIAHEDGAITLQLGGVEFVIARRE